MKRILSLILAIILISCLMVSCDGAHDGDPANTEATTAPHVHVFSKATCNAPKTCECGATEGKVSNKHNFQDGVCVDCTKRLIVEIARLVTNPATEKPISGFYISRGENDRVEYVTVRADIIDKALIQQGIYSRVAIKIDQDAMNTGIYDWVVERNTYIPAIDDYDRAYLYGTLNAADFVDAATLTSDYEKSQGFSESDIAKYRLYVPIYVDRMVTQTITPALENNPSKITVADIGFVNYIEEATTNKPND